MLRNPWKIGVFSCEIILYTVIKTKANWWAYWPLWSFSPLAHFLREQSFKLHTFPIIDYRKGSAAHSYEICLYSEDIVHLQLLTWLKKKFWTCFNSFWTVRVTISGYIGSNPRRGTHHPGCWVLLGELSCLSPVLIPVPWCFVKPRYILPQRLGWV